MGLYLFPRACYRFGVSSFVDICPSSLIGLIYTVTSSAVIADAFIAFSVCAFPGNWPYDLGHCFQT